LDGAAAVLAVRLFRRIGDDVGFDLLHPATAREEFLHGAGQGVTLLLLGLHAGKLFGIDRLLGLLARRRGHIGVIVAVDVVGSAQLLAVILVGGVQFILLEIFVAHSHLMSCPKSGIYSPDKIIFDLANGRGRSTPTRRMSRADGARRSFWGRILVASPRNS